MTLKEAKELLENNGYIVLDEYKVIVLANKWKTEYCWIQYNDG